MTEREETALRRAAKGLEPDTLREIVKSAIKELIEERVKAFGWFSLKWIGVALIGAGLYAILLSNGWTHK